MIYRKHIQREYLAADQHGRRESERQNLVEWGERDGCHAATRRLTAMATRSSLVSRTSIALASSIRRGQ